MEQLMEYTVLTEAGAPAATAARNFPAKGFIKKGLNGRLAEHVNEPMENVHLHAGVSARTASTASRSARMVETAAIAVASDGALEAPKASLTTLIGGGGARGLGGAASG